MGDTVGIIGTGNMGGALVRGLVHAGSASVLVCDRDGERAQALAEEVEGVEAVAEIQALSSRSDIVMIAVKPGDVGPVLSELSDAVDAESVVISAAAGVTLERLRVGLGPAANLFRMMPNLSVALGEGVIALSAQGSVEPEVYERVQDLLSGLGTTAVVPEEQFNAVTAVSASGPGMLAVVLEAMEDGAVSVGLSRGVARSFVQQMVLGTARMLLEGEEAPSALKDRVASPAGTTIAGIATLEDAAVRGAFIRAIQMAEARGREL